MINNSNNLNNKEEEIISIEKNNINMLILCRSLYILKKKFEKNKDTINKIYLKYQNENNNNNNLLTIPLEYLNEVINDIMNISEFNIIVYKEFNDLITADLLNNENIIKKILILLNTFINEKVDYYNDLYLKKRKTEEKFINEKNNMNNNNDNEKLINKEEINENNKNNENIENDEEKILKKEEEKNDKNEEKNLNEQNNKDLENNKENNNEQIENEKNDDKIDKKNENEKNNTENIKKEINLNLKENSLNINNNNLFCDTIPLIIADFIQNHKNFAIISKNDDFNEETKKLFDNEIIKKIDLIEKSNPSENKKIKLKNLLYNLNSITNHIKIYQNLLITKSKEGTNLNHLYEMIKKLKIQKSKIQNEINLLQNNNNNNNNNENFNKSNSNLNKTRSISSKIKPKKNKNILRKNALTEIFYFYSKQHNKINSLTTFENIQNKEQNLDLSEFSKFCIEFKLTIKMNKIVELFKKNTSDSKKMNFNEFVNILEKLSIEINNEKKKILENRIKLLNLKINEIEENEKNKLNKLNKINNNNNEKKEEQKNILPKIQTNKKQNNNNKNNKIILYNNKEELSNEISQLLLDLEKLKNKNFTVLLEELYDFLEIDSPQKYRNKMKGFLLPFSTHDKFSREQPINNNNNNRNRLNSQNNKKIREILINKYNEKINAKKLKEKREKEILFEKKIINFQEKNRLLSEHLKGKKNYINIMKEKEEIKKKKKNVFTWDDIEKLNSDNILLNNNNNNNNKDENNENNKNIRNSIEEIFNIKDNSIVNDSSEDDIY